MSDWTHGERRSVRDFLLGRRDVVRRLRRRLKPAPPPDPRPRCDRCFGAFDELLDVQVCRQTHGSPAEYERLCRDCAWPFLDHDPQDREPDNDQLEERRRR